MRRDDDDVGIGIGIGIGNTSLHITLNSYKKRSCYIQNTHNDGFYLFLSC